MLWLPGIWVFLIDNSLAANLDDRILFVEELDVITEIAETIGWLAATTLACSYSAGGSATGSNKPLGGSARLALAMAWRLRCSRVRNRKGRQRASVIDASGDVVAAALPEHVIEDVVEKIGRRHPVVYLGDEDAYRCPAGEKLAYHYTALGPLKQVRRQRRRRSCASPPLRSSPPAPPARASRGRAGDTAAFAAGDYVAVFVQHQAAGAKQKREVYS